jgi:hypothetical protein
MPQEDPTEVHGESVPFLGLEAEFLQQCAAKHGATAIEAYGGYERHPYERDESVDLIMVLRK